MNFPQLATNIQTAHNVLQQNAVRAINQNVTARNWLVGYWIVEFEQNGEDRAKYGDKLLSELAKSIQIKGLGRSMLNLCRLFYKVYPEIGKEIAKYLLANNNRQIIQSRSGLLQSSNNQQCEIIQTLSGKSYGTELLVANNEPSLPKVNRDKIFNYLSFSHIAELLSIDNQLKRALFCLFIFLAISFTVGTMAACVF